MRSNGSNVIARESVLESAIHESGIHSGIHESGIHGAIHVVGFGSSFLFGIAILFGFAFWTLGVVDWRRFW